jgi:hypothetical protein
MEFTGSAMIANMTIDHIQVARNPSLFKHAIYLYSTTQLKELHSSNNQNTTHNTRHHTPLRT